MSRTSQQAPSRFPQWVAAGSLVFVLWLFFGNTVPALHEREELRAHAGELARLRASYDAAIQEARLGVGPNAHYDLQALLVAIDQRGFTPLELCAAYPERRERPGEPGDPGPAADGGVPDAAPPPPPASSGEPR
jgi:hypothetical protein